VNGSFLLAIGLDEEDDSPSLASRPPPDRESRDAVQQRKHIRQACTDGINADCSKMASL